MQWLFLMILVLMVPTVAKADVCSDVRTSYASRLLRLSQDTQAALAMTTDSAERDAINQSYLMQKMSLESERDSLLVSAGCMNTGGTTTPPPSGGGTTPPPSGGGTTPPPTDGGGTTPPPSTGGGGTTTPPPPPGDGGGVVTPPTDGDPGDGSGGTDKCGDLRQQMNREVEDARGHSIHGNSELAHLYNKWRGILRSEGCLEKKCNWGQIRRTEGGNPNSGRCNKK